MSGHTSYNKGHGGYDRPAKSDLSSYNNNPSNPNGDMIDSSVKTDYPTREITMLNSPTSTSSSSSGTGTPSLLKIHLAIIAAQVSFGTGSVVGRLGLPSTNPILFALIREGIAGPCLCILAYILDRRIPERRHWNLFLIPGVCLYLNQLFFIVGLKLSSSVTGSAWQPSQAIMAAVIGWLIGIELLNPLKLVGILVGFGGALFMVLYKAEFSSKDIKSEFGGNLCYFVNCLATALYLILGRPALDEYPSSTVTGWCYIVASLLMVITALFVGNYRPAWKFVCHECTSAWVVPESTWAALAYWVIMQSFLSYLLMTWANKYAEPSVNLAYTVLQPLTASVVSTLVIYFKLYPQCHSALAQHCLHGPSLKDLGAIGIAIGLFLVIRSDRKTRQERYESRGSNLGKEPLIRPMRG